MRRGFTLLEVLISIVVFVMAVGAILPLFAVGTMSHRRAMDQTEAALLAARVFARIQQDLTAFQPRDISDAKFEDGGATYTYDARFVPFDRGDARRWAFIVKVRIKWQEGGEERVEKFQTVMLRKIRR